MTTNTQTEPCSLDAFFDDLEFDKLKAIELLKQRQELTPENLEFIAKTLYQTTLKTVTELDYIETDELGNTGCTDPVKYLEEEVASYGLKKRDKSLAFNRLALQAFSFASANLWENIVYRTKKPGKMEKLPLEQRKYYLWKPKQDINPEQTKRFIESALAEFDQPNSQVKSYLVANLEQDL